MKNSLYLIVVMLFLSFASALEIEATSNTNILVKDVDSAIELTLTITNATSGNYNVYTLSDISITPQDIFTIPEGSIEKTFTLTQNENLDVDGYYTFTYTLNHRGVEKYDNKFTVNLLDLDEVLEISSESITATESNEISFYVKNKENVQLENLRATFSSLVFDTQQVFDLEPFETKTFTVVADGYQLRKTKAGVYLIDAVFETKKGPKKLEGTLYLGEKKGIATNQDKAGVLIQTETITKLNSGNVFERVEITTSRNIISRLFTTFDTDPTIIERSGFFVTYTWVKERLGPAEVMTVKAKTNYLLPILIIIVAAFALVGLKRFSQAKVSIKKSVRPVKTKGGEFALKIILSIKALKSVENLSVVDRVPRIVKVYKKFGSIEPDKIDPHTRRIHWNIGDMGTGEERVLSYIVYSKVGVVGKFSLPKALTLFEKDEKVHEVESNNVFFMNEQVDTAD